MSEQRIDALLATIDAHLAEVLRLKAERDELRECLKWVMEDISAMHPDMLRAYVAQRARAVLERTEPK